MIKNIITVIAVIVISCFCPNSFANDSAVGISATGIYFKEEKNISIEKEYLFISEDRIEVTYLFKNNSNIEITTEIAFPIPDYEYDISEMTSYPMYDDFTVEVNGIRIKHNEESRAFINNTEHTKLLNDMNISIKNFGHFDDFKNAKGSKGIKPQSFFEKLNKTQQQLLVKNKLVIREGSLPIPNWKVTRKYYWTQTFQANGTLTIKHSYTPYKSFDYVSSDAKFYKEACIDMETSKWLKAMPYPHYYRFVKYILTTANNWKQPIKNFTLEVDNAGREKDIRISTCFPQRLIKTDKSRYKATITDFIPKQDITVYFIGQ